MSEAWLLALTIKRWFGPSSTRTSLICPWSRITGGVSPWSASIFLPHPDGIGHWKAFHDMVCPWWNTFFSENLIMLEILEANGPDLGIGDIDLQEAVTLGSLYLSEAGTVSVDSAELMNQVLTADIRVENKVGHKLPTSIPIRRAFLHITVVHQATGKVVFESGKPLSNGAIEGVNSDEDRSTYEPHYDLIDSQDKVQVYEAIMHNTDNEVTYTLLRASGYHKDNRLIPLGFDKDNVPDEVKPVGVCLEDNDFVGGSDVVTLQVSGLTGTEYIIHVELLDQTMAFPVLQDLFVDSPEEPLIQDFEHLYRPFSDRFESIANTTETVTLVTREY